VSSCRSCSAPILWVRTERGKKMPLDREPVELSSSSSGLFVLREEKDPGGPLAIAVTPGFVGEELEPAYVSHFFTCPERDKWRRS
jgi:hypothetical protein